MKVLVVGGGSIGRRHIGNFSQLPGVQVSACELNAERLAQIKKQFPGVTPFSNLDQALADKPNAVAICTPPHIHTQIGQKAADAGCHLFIEKPIASSLAGLRELLTDCDHKGLVVMTAYLFRFSPSLRRAKEIVDSGKLGRVLSVRTEYASYLPEWHPWEDYRKFYMAKKAEGGGAVLDESHAIDFTRWLVGEIQDVTAVVDTISPLEIETDDVAELLVRFQNKAVGTIHLDLFSRHPKGRIELTMEKGTIAWDRFTNEVKTYHAERNVWEVEPFNRPLAEFYVDEAKHFLECIERKTKPVIDGWDGLRSVEIALAAMESHEQGKRITLPAAQRSQKAAALR